MCVERESDYTVWQTFTLDHFSLKQLETVFVAIWASLEILKFSFLVRMQSSPALYPSQDSHHLSPKYLIHPPIFEKSLTIWNNNYIHSWKRQERGLLQTNWENPHVGTKPTDGKTTPEFCTGWYLPNSLSTIFFRSVLLQVLLKKMGHLDYS